MTRILLVDDDPNLRTLLTKILVKNQFDLTCAKNGAAGLEQAKALKPDLIILDIIMQDMDGFEVARRLRADPACAHIPIMALTAFATPRGRKAAAEAGMNAFVIKPFSVQDIVALIKTMTADSYEALNSPKTPPERSRQAKLVAVHSLRGGLGCTALAVNLAYALKKKWQAPTLLLDGDFASGQVAMSLNWQGRLSWSDLLRASSRDAASRILEDESIVHKSGMHVLAAPRDPGDADQFTPRMVGHSLGSLRERYEYVVADLAHDLRDNTFELMKDAETIFYLLSPDSVSLQLTRKALKTYAAMGIKPANVELILVDTRPNSRGKLSQIEEIVDHSILAYLPYAAEMTGVINRGLPFINAHPNHEISGLVEDLANILGKPAHKEEAKVMSGPTQPKPRPQLRPAGQNGGNHGIGRSLLKQMGFAK
jgi:pilus assembly protein CpaE